jgi:hypothetical protein
VRTDENNRQMVERKKKQAETNRQLVFLTLLELAKPATSRQVFEEINKKLLRDAKKEFQDFIDAGKIDSKKNHKYWIKLWKQRNVNERTVRRHLNGLRDDGFLTHSKKYYSLSSIDYPEAKIWAKEFGHAALHRAMRILYPDYNRLEYNFKMLVEIFGSYLVYCFIEAASPISNNKNPIPGYRRDELTLAWVESMINPVRLFHYFVAFLKSQPDEHEVRKIRKVKFSIRNGKYFFRGTPDDFTWNLASIMPGVIKPSVSRISAKENHKTRKSVLEVDIDKIRNVKEIFQKNYAMLYTQLDGVNPFSDIKNKEGVKLKANMKRYSYEEEIHWIWHDLLEKIPEWEHDLAVKKG